jgi:16S rRNA (adenine1518-N6/adenine1519-N6)-dimethyltransferase
MSSFPRKSAAFFALPMKLSEIGKYSARNSRCAMKTLGQNFLHDQNLARWMVQEAEISAADFVWKSGQVSARSPNPLLATGARVLAIEKDGRLADFLRTRLSIAA